MTYPAWSYYPRNARAPQWVNELVGAVDAVRGDVDSQPVLAFGDDKRTSDAVLAKLRPGMEALGYQVESGKAAAQKIRRPVLFGDDGLEQVSYEIDAFHDGLGIAVEVEAGRGAKGNADYRDIVRTSLLLDARYFVLMTPATYRHVSSGKGMQVAAYSNTRNLLNAIYASQRLVLPFEGVLLIGY